NICDRHTSSFRLKAIIRVIDILRDSSDDSLISGKELRARTNMSSIFGSIFGHRSKKTIIGSFSNARYALICERTHSSANVSTQKVSLLSSFAATLDTKRRLKFKAIINFFMIYVEKYQTITY